MWQKATALDQRSSGAAVQIHALDDVSLRVDKVDSLGRIVDGQTVRPVEFRVTNDTLTTAAVDESTFDFGTGAAARTGAPVGPAERATRLSTSIDKDYSLYSLYEEQGDRL